MIKRGFRLVVILVFMLFSFTQAKLYNPFEEAFDFSCYRPKDAHHCQRTGWFAPNILREAIELQVNFFFSAASFKLATSFLPFYVGACMVDENIQSCFYDKRWHKNCYQMPWWCHDAAKLGISIPIIAFAGLTVFGQTDEKRTTGRVFLIGMPFLIFGKDILRSWQANHCLRPKCEKFSRWKKYYGGFPSGHMAEATYITVLGALRFGAKAAIPLSLLSLFVAGTFINCNRHYTSQIVAGAALGTMYAVAANKVIEHELNEKKLCLGIDCDECGNPALSLTCQF